MDYKHIESLKGLAILGVIFAHSDFKNRFNANILELIFHLQLIFGWCVLAFFYTSGLLKGKGPVKAVNVYLKARFKRLILPCLVFSLTYKMILSIIYLIERGNLEATYSVTLLDIFEWLLVPIGPQFYFLFYLFLISVVTHFILLKLKIEIIIYLTPLLFLCSVIFINIPSSPYGPEVELIPLYAYSYVLGYISSSQNNRLVQQTYILLLAVVAAAMYLNQSFLYLYLISAVLIFGLLIKYKILTELFIRLRLGKYSGAIYVWHAPLVLPVISIISNRFLGDGLSAFACMIILTILVCISISKMVDKYSLFRLWKF